MYELKKKVGKVLTRKSVGTGPSSYEKRIYRAAISQRLRNTGLENRSGRSNESTVVSNGFTVSCIPREVNSKSLYRTTSFVVF